MTHLDQHVSFVRGKLAVGLFLEALAWTSLGLGALVFLYILIHRLFQLVLPHSGLFLLGGLAVAGLASLAWAMLRRPTLQQAAVAIDQRLGLKEKFSTALYIRTDGDPFAQAAVRDAETTAQNVSLHKRFPLAFPRPFLGTFAIAIIAGLAYWQLPTLDLFGKDKAREQQVKAEQRAVEAKKIIQNAVVEVQAQAKVFGSNEAIQNAKRELELSLAHPPREPETAQRTALKALQDVNEAVKQQLSQDKRFAMAQNDAKMFRAVAPAPDEKGPVADAQRALAKGDFLETVNQIQQAVDKFDKMDKKEQEKALQQMKQMAQQLQQMAQNKQQQQQMQQKLQQMGANQQQAQQMQQKMQQAAAGNQQAAQQLQQMAKQMMQQMNNGQGPNQQQQQQINQMMQQMQAQANGMMQAQQMAQAAQQMAQAMQQAQQAKQGAPAGQQQAGQQMANAQQQLQQQLQQLQALQNDMQQMAAAQQQLQQAANPGPGQANNGQGQQPPQAGQGQNQQWNPNPGQPQANQTGGGPGQGPRDFMSQAPFTVKTEKTNTQDIEEGKILASFLVKAGTITGEAKEKMKDAAVAAQHDPIDEVEQELISRQAQETVKNYFSSMEKGEK